MKNLKSYPHPNLPPHIHKQEIKNLKSFKYAFFKTSERRKYFSGNVKHERLHNIYMK